MSKEISNEKDLQDSIKASGKCRKALRELVCSEKDVDDVKERLLKIEIALFEIVPRGVVLEDKSSETTVKLKSCSGIDDRKTRVEKIVYEKFPPRIEFKYNGLCFYIDFLLLSSGGSSDAVNEGAIIYGAQRPQSLLEWSTKDEETKNLLKEYLRDMPGKHFVSRKRPDGQEDKPILKLVVNDHGRISESDRLDDEWWIRKDENSDWTIDSSLNYS